MDRSVSKWAKMDQYRVKCTKSLVISPFFEKWQGNILLICPLLIRFQYFHISTQYLGQFIYLFINILIFFFLIIYWIVLTLHVLCLYTFIYFNLERTPSHFFYLFVNYYYFNSLCLMFLILSKILEEQINNKKIVTGSKMWLNTTAAH